MHRLSDCIVSHCGVFFNIILIKQDNCSFPLPCTRMARRQSVCASATSLGINPHHCKAHHLRLVANDVLALLRMMLTFGQTMLCPAGTNEKIPKADAFGIFWRVLTKKMPLVFPFAKTRSSAIRTLCNASAVKMYCNINLIPFWLEFGFTFRAYVCFGYHNHIQNDKQDNYGNGYKIPWNIKVTAKPIHLTGSKHKS